MIYYKFKFQVHSQLQEEAVCVAQKLFLVNIWVTKAVPTASTKI